MFTFSPVRAVVGTMGPRMRHMGAATPTAPQPPLSEQQPTDGPQLAKSVHESKQAAAAGAP